MRRIGWLLTTSVRRRRGVRRRASGGARLRPGGVEVLGTRHRPQLPGTHPFHNYSHSLVRRRAKN
jgi:hypothetical protein